MKFGAPWKTSEGYRGEFQGAVGASMLSIIMLIEFVKTSEMTKERNHLYESVTQEEFVSVENQGFENNTYRSKHCTGQ